MPDLWPWPADTGLEKRSRVAHIYRDALKDERPDICAQLDEVMVAYGQMWILDHPALDPESTLTATQLAEWAHVSVAAVTNWVNRGHIEAFSRDETGRKLYRLADVIEYQAAARRARERRQ
jgi:hypothetical protein